MNDTEQEIINENSYKELLTGKKGKDPRWHSVKGLGRSINILSGVRNRSSYQMIQQGQPTQHIIDYCDFTDKILRDKKDRLKKEIHEG